MALRSFATLVIDAAAKTVTVLSWAAAGCPASVADTENRQTSKARKVMTALPGRNAPALMSNVLERPAGIAVPAAAAHAQGVAGRDQRSNVPLRCHSPAWRG